MSAFDPKRTYNIYSITSSAWPSSDSRIVLLPQLLSLLFFTGVWRAKGGAPIMDVRIVAILVGVAITFIIQNGLDARWYVSVSAGVVGYVVAHLIGWAINAHKRHSQAKQRDPLTMHLILINSTARGWCAAAAAPVRRRFGI
jgi:hypothetical protein